MQLPASPQQDERLGQREEGVGGIGDQEGPVGPGQVLCGGRGRGRGRWHAGDGDVVGHLGRHTDGEQANRQALMQPTVIARS